MSHFQMARLDLVTFVVDSYDPAIERSVGKLGLELVGDSPSVANDGHAKRWVVVRPLGAQTGILLVRADSVDQKIHHWGQVAGRVGFFLR
jgi:hypothetical protein